MTLKSILNHFVKLCTPARQLDPGSPRRRRFPRTSGPGYRPQSFRFARARALPIPVTRFELAHRRARLFPRNDQNL